MVDDTTFPQYGTAERTIGDTVQYLYIDGVNRNQRRGMKLQKCLVHNDDLKMYQKEDCG